MTATNHAPPTRQSPQRLLVDALGATIAIDLAGTSDELAAEVRRAWRDASLPSEPSGELVATVEVIDGGPGSHERVLAELSQRVTLAAIAAHRGTLWMLHAAGLALPDGRVVVFIGPSGRGKTTAARTLGARYGYVSDETVGIDLATGRVLAYRKPLSIIESPGHKAQRAPSDVGLAPLPPVELRLAGVVLLDRREDGPAEPTVAAVDLGDVIDDIVSQTSHLAALPSALRTIAALLADLGGVQRVTYREAASLADLIEPLASGVGAMRWHPVGVRADGQGGYSRVGAVDAIGLDDPDRLLVLQVDAAGLGTVRLLAGIAPVLWRAADGASEAELVAAAVLEHGRPPGVDVDAAVRHAVRELEGVGLLVHRDPVDPHASDA